MFAVRRPQKRAGPKAQVLQQSCTGNSFTRDGNSPLKAGTRVSTPVALPMLITYEIAFQKRILATT
jgi:hypothetical protein